jgi:hypothetical protein
MFAVRLGPTPPQGDDGRRALEAFQRRCHINLKRRRAKFGSPSSGSGRGSSSPRLERFVSEGAERAARCEMALDVEGVVDGGVNRQEALG